MCHAVFFSLTTLYSTNGTKLKSCVNFGTTLVSFSLNNFFKLLYCSLMVLKVPLKTNTELEMLIANDDTIQGNLIRL